MKLASDLKKNRCHFRTFMNQTFMRPFFFIIVRAGGQVSHRRAGFRVVGDLEN